MSSILIGVPHYGGFKAEMACSLVAAVADLSRNGHEVALSTRGGPYTHWNREQLGEDAVEAGVGHLMMIDADMMFLPDSIGRMLGRGKPIIGGFYMMKTTPPMNTIKLSDGNGGYLGTKNWTPPPEPFPVAAVATGFLLISTDVLRTLPKPWFPCEYTDGPDSVGEDVAFCRAALAHGYEVWCDPTFRLVHIGDYGY
jgi:hypothetical protein